MDFINSKKEMFRNKGDEINKSLSSSITDGTSKFFTSVMSKKNGLFNDISSKFENTFSLRSNSTSSMGTSDSDSSIENANDRDHAAKHGIGPSDGQRDRPKQRPGKEITHDPDFQRDRPKQRPGKEINDMANFERDRPKQRPGKEINKDSDIQRDRPKQRPGKEINERHVITKSEPNGGARAKQRPPKDSSSSTGSRHEDKSNVYGVNMSFDEPLYSSESSSMVDSGKRERPHRPDCDGSASITPVNTNVVSPELVSNDSGDGTKPPKRMTIRRRSSTVDEMLFDDYIAPDEEPADVNGNGHVSPPHKKKSLKAMGDLISFDEDEMESLNSKYRLKAKLHSKKGQNGRVSSNSPPNQDSNSLDSGSESELAGIRPYSTSMDSSEAEFGGDPVHRSGSDGSISSTDSQPDPLTLECMEFMKGFVQKMFNPNEEIPQMLKAKFGELCQHSPGRLWFSRYVTKQREDNKCVDEQICFRMVQYIAIVLFECAEAEDFSPAKSLMNMCFTFYHESLQPNGKHYKHFVYSYLKDQPIWQSLRFWNAAFFDAVQCERRCKPVSTSADGSVDIIDDCDFQENVTFGLLGTFVCNMRAFGLHQDLCFEFLRKQCIIANLSKEKIKLLRENVEKQDKERANQNH